jgi:long-chain acyl-CoA synthetase
MLDDMIKVRPQYLSSVPRIWESVYSGVQRTFKAASGIKKVLINFFLSVAFTHNFFHALTFSLLPTKVPRNCIADFLLGIIPFLLLWPLRALGNLLVFRKIKAKLGGKFIAGISGGGALPEYIDLFFQAAGIKLLEGYGLTETAPILSVRKQGHPVHGTVGPLLKDVEHKIINKAGKEVGPLHKGVLYVKSPQVMAGYYKQPEMTAQVLVDGWFNTGDLVNMTQRGEIRIIGRAKETIVLIGGENIEPTPIEDKLRQSELIDNVMIVGQDKKFLGALITPSWDVLEKIAAEQNISYLEKEELVKNAAIQGIIGKEIQELVSAKTGFKQFEQIYRFCILPKSFEVGMEMTASLKVKRNVVSKMYKKEIDKLFE